MPQACIWWVRSLIISVTQRGENGLWSVKAPRTAICSIQGLFHKTHCTHYITAQWWPSSSAAGFILPFFCLVSFLPVAKCRKDSSRSWHPETTSRLHGFSSLSYSCRFSSRDCPLSFMNLWSVPPEHNAVLLVCLTEGTKAPGQSLEETKFYFSSVLMFGLNYPVVSGLLSNVQICTIFETGVMCSSVASKLVTHSNPQLMNNNSELIVVLSAEWFCYIRLSEPSSLFRSSSSSSSSSVCSAADSSLTPIWLRGLPEEQINGTTFSFTAIKTPVVPLSSSWRPYPNGSVAVLWRLD